MSFKPSPYQQAVFDFVENERGSAIVNAVAGAGKTTTIVKALELIPSDQRVLFLAFNKKIATELQKRVPAHVRAATFHSRGFAAWRRQHDDVEINDRKTRELLQKHYSDIEVRAWGTQATKLVSVAKAAGVNVLLPNDASTFSELAYHFDIQLSEESDIAERAIEGARRLLALSIEEAQAPVSVLDFDDMLYMPLIANTPFYRQDWVFVDEAQDTNQVQLALLKRMLDPRRGRLVAVGDPKQAIYGFRGADANAMGNIATEFKCKELPLTISYRCARHVVKLAQTLVPHLEASDTAPEGEVLDLSKSEVKFTNSDVIICRNTAPIVELAYEFIGKGIGCKVLGREIGKALEAVVDKMKARDIEDLLVKLDAFRERETSKLIAKGKDDQAEAINDKCDCIRAIANNLPETNRTISGIKDSINRMFSDSSEGLLTLCTAHKSKGLEWDRVFIWRADLMPSKWARQPWQQEQERNLQYVAWTRAKKTLVFLSDLPAAPAQPRETMKERALRIDKEKNTLPHEFWDESPEGGHQVYDPRLTAI